MKVPKGYQPVALTLDPLGFLYRKAAPRGSGRCECGKDPRWVFRFFRKDHRKTSDSPAFCSLKCFRVWLRDD